MTSLRRLWPVLILCCVLAFNTMGMAFGIGAIFTDIMDTFGVSRAMASLVQSVCFGISYGIGAFTGHFQKRHGARVTVITGSVLSTAGCVIAFLATHIVQVIVGFGVIAGVGISFNYLTAQIVTGTMFYDVKSLALSINSVFTAVGTALYPLFLRQVIHHYSLRGTFLILAAINCQMILCGALITLFASPTPGKTEVNRVLEAEAADEAAVAAADKAGEKELHGNLKKSGGGGSKTRCGSLKEIRNWRRINYDDSIVSSHCAVVIFDDGALSCPASQDNDDENDDNFADSNHHPELDTCLDTYPDRHPSANLESDVPKDEVISLMSETQGQDLSKDDTLLPLNNKFVSVKPTESHLTSSKTPFVENVTNDGRSLTDVNSTRTSSRCSFCRICKASCPDKEILRDVTFVLFGVFGPSSYLFFTQPMMFMTDMVKSNQLTVEDGSFFLTIIFLGNLMGRVLAGFLFRLFKSRILCVYSASVAAGGVTCLFYVFAAEYLQFVAVSFALGLSFGLVCATHTMVFLEILGPGRYAVGIGYVATTSGFYFLLAGPYGGTIRDLTNSYEPVFYIAVAHGLIVGTLLFITALRFNHRSKLSH